MNKSNLNRINWLLFAVFLGSLFLIETEAFKGLGLVALAAALIAQIFISYRVGSVPFDAKEIEDWKQKRAGGLKNYILQSLGRLMIGWGLFLTILTTVNFLTGKPVSEALSPGVIITMVAMLCILPVVSFETWRTNEEKFNKP